MMKHAFRILHQAKQESEVSESGLAALLGEDEAAFQADRSASARLELRLP